MISIKKEGILLSKTDLKFENENVLNPAVVQVGNLVHLFYRAVSEGNHSTLGYCRLNGPLNIEERWDKPIMVPEYDYELHGIEDPRIVNIDQTYYMAYTAFDGINARGAYATTTDLTHFHKQGLLAPPITYARFVSLVERAGIINKSYYTNRNFYYQESDPDQKMLLWDKDLIFFPRRINGKLTFLHRIRPGIQLISVDDLNELTPAFWKDYVQNLQDHIVMDPEYNHESNYIGGGCPPIETKDGWLIIYHGVEETKRGNIYSACAALLDLDNPLKVIARLPYALFSPELDWEKKGEVSNVVFPTGTAQFGDTLYIYYGAADSTIACASVSLSELLSELTNSINR
jgi:beta-1,2-mannobiose phosphorylase / 1,2-beta-oligomannan phosphorylase